MRRMYLGLLMEMVKGHGSATGAAQIGLQRVASEPGARISPELIEIIKILCDCKAIVVILECLCKLFTPGRVAGTAPE